MLRAGRRAAAAATPRLDPRMLAIDLLFLLWSMVEIFTLANTELNIRSVNDCSVNTAPDCEKPDKWRDGKRDPTALFDQRNLFVVLTGGEHFFITRVITTKSACVPSVAASLADSPPVMREHRADRTAFAVAY